MSPTPKIVDARGLACPQPVILTRKALAEGGFELLEVIVDNASSKENVARFATHAGCNVESIDESGAEARIRIRPSSITSQSSLPSAEDFCDVSSQPKQNENIETVFLSSNTIGRGSDELGALLMRAFLYTLTESDIVPKRLLLMNSGVLLAVEGSEHLTNLRRLVDLDVEILVCGTCLEFFKVKDTLAVGRVSNMQEIQGALMEGRALSF